MKYIYMSTCIFFIISGCSSDMSVKKISDAEKDTYQNTSQYFEPEDKKNYLKDLEVSAKNGNTSAQNELAGLYAFGDGVPQSGEKFIYWSELAALKGNSLAQLNLGTAYFLGTNGVTQNIPKAKKWLELAASNKESIAENYLQKIKNNDIPDANIPEDIKILMQSDK